MQMEYGAGICNKFPQGGLAIAVTAIAVEYYDANLCTKMTWFKIHEVSNTSCMRLFNKLEFIESHCLHKWLLGDHGFEDAVMFCRML